MAGITETVFRTICKESGADIVVSEMVSAESIVKNSKNIANLLYFQNKEHPFGIQLFGANAKTLAYAAEYVEKHTSPDFIDLNCGCPVKKVVKKNGGSALLKDPKLYANILSNMVQAVSTPITVKIRSGWSQDNWVDIEYAKIAQDCGVSAITLHPRFKTMGFSGHSFWERIKMVKESVSIPVIGNGDIINPEKACEMYSLTGCDSIMIGRASYGNPWIFNQIKGKLNDKYIKPISNQEKYKTVIHHLNEFLQVHGAILTERIMKKHICWYIKGMNGASFFRNKIFNSNGIKELKEIVDEIFIKL